MTQTWIFIQNNYCSHCVLPLIYHNGTIWRVFCPHSTILQMKHKLENQSQIPRPQNNEIQMHSNFKTQKPHTKQTNEITLHSTPQSKTLILPNPASAFVERHTQNRTSSFATNNPQTQMVSLWNASFESYLWNTLLNVLHFRNALFKCNFRFNFSTSATGTHTLFV